MTFCFRQAAVTSLGILSHVMTSDVGIENIWYQFPHMSVQITNLSNSLIHYYTNKANISLFFWLWVRTCLYAWPANTNVTQFVRSYVPIDIFWWYRFRTKKFDPPPMRIDSCSPNIWIYSDTPSWFARSRFPLHHCFSNFVTQHEIF
jgi:hypothetical protein